jgi:hypothetical protein
MDAHPDDSYRLEADLHRTFAQAGGVEEDVRRALLLAQPSVEHLATVALRLHEEAVNLVPETPWYLTILAAALVGAMVAFLHLVK